MKTVYLLLGTLLLVTIFFACAPRIVPIEKSLPSSDIITRETQDTGKESWQVEWGKWLEASKRERRVLIVTNIGPEVNRALSQGFQEKFGIQAEFIVMRGPEIAMKLETERRAGLNLTDIVFTGSSTVVANLQPGGHLEPMEPQLILPEVRDPKVWWAGKLPVVGYGYAVGVLKYASIPLSINTEKVKPEEIKSYRDLLNPKWKGRIVMDDPTVGGSGLKWASYVLWTKTAGGEEFLRSLVRQEPAINRDRRLVVEWLARGKYDIALNARPEVMKSFIDLGAPLKFLTPQEGTYVTAGGSVASLKKNAAHPNAANVFLNWLLTKEAALLWSKASGTQSARVDVPTDFLYSEDLRQPGIKYFDGDEDEFVKNGEVPETLRAIFEPVLK